VSTVFDDLPPVSYADGAAWLERYSAALQAFSGDDLVAIFTEDAELRLHPFEAPLVGHNAIRAYCLRLAETDAELELTIERHWTSGPTVLAAWHGSAQRRAGGRQRLAGFLTAELDGGRCRRFRRWALADQGSPT
jgi:hypothetical protein